MSWSPAPRDELDSIIADGLAEYDEDVRAEWRRIRIEPTKWRCSPWGDEGGGFWAVAIDDGKVLWFNDIEDGFNRSAFSQHGVIDEYVCDQTTFTEILEQIAQEKTSRATEALEPGGAPPGLAGPGEIVRRQTTYWELRSATGAMWRASFVGKEEFVFAEAAYPGAEVLTEHPLLALYDEPARSLYFHGLSIDARGLAVRIASTIHHSTRGWRGLDADAVGHLQRQLAGGYGLLMDAPESVCRAVASVLEAGGVGASILGDAPARPGRRVLLLGRSYVIATAFKFERRD